MPEGPDNNTNLLNPDEPTPYRVINPLAETPTLLVCDHASSRFPEALGDMGLDPFARRCHLAIDIGAGALTERLSESLGVTAVLAQYSRLVVDCNRQLLDPSAFLVFGDGIFVPGNNNLSDDDKKRRSDAIYWPYHKAVADQIGRLRNSGPPPLFVSIHSFTPVLNGISRSLEMGVLWDADEEVAKIVIDELRAAGYKVGDNEPYSGKAPQDFTVDHHAEGGGLRHAAIEIRQDLIDNDHGVDEVAAVLHRVFDLIPERIGMRGQARTACEVPGQVGDPQPVADSGSQPEASQLFWTGSGYVGVWAATSFEAEALYLTRLDRTGAKVGADVSLTDPGIRIHSWTAEWNGSHLALLYVFDRFDWEPELGLFTVDSSGTRIGDEHLLTTTGWPYDPNLRWTGDGYSLLWIDDGSPIYTYFRRATALAEPVGPTVGFDAYYQIEAFLWNGSSHWLIHEAGGFWLEQLDPVGNEIGSQMLVAAPSSVSDPSLAWTGQQYGMTWSDSRDGNDEIYFARFDSSGARVDDEVRVTDDLLDDSSPHVVWTGAEFVLVWTRDPWGSKETYVVRLDAAGMPLADPEPLDGATLPPGLALWTGSGLALLSADAFASIGCDCVDLDGDATTTCQNDCDDGAVTTYPGAPQVCDGINNDCTDPAWPSLPDDEIDGDGDGFSACQGDCDDSEPAVGPAATEECNQVDDDCDGLVDENAIGEDDDGDGTHGLCDNCPFLENFAQDDLDGDGRGDACDNCLFDLNPGQGDRDDDSEGDFCDLDDGLITVHFDVPDLIEWDAEQGPAAWDLYRGDLALLLGGGDYTQVDDGTNPLAGRFCGLAMPLLMEAIGPDSGEVVFFLVTEGGSIDLGTASDGSARPNIAPCP